MICANLFLPVQTGDSILDELAREGGPLWPIDLTMKIEGQPSPVDAQWNGQLEPFRTGTDDFDWTANAPVKHFQRSANPSAKILTRVEFHLNEILAENTTSRLMI